MNGDVNNSSVTPLALLKLNQDAFGPEFIENSALPGWLIFSDNY